MGLFDDQERTEDASQRKLDKAREQGEVAQSQELTIALRTLVDTLGLSLLGGGIFAGFVQMMRRGLQLDLAQAPGRVGTTAGAVALARQGTQDLAEAIVPLLAVFGAGAAGAVLIQRGPMWVPTRMQPKLQRFDPRQNLARLFKGEALTKLGTTLIKLGLVVAVVVAVVKSRLPELTTLSGATVAVGLGLGGSLIKQLFSAALGVLLAVGIVDYVIARQRFLKQQRMTKQEVRDEHKQDEGDPMQKMRRRALQREYRTRTDMLAAVETADVILNNPTHLSVALKYDREQGGAPRVVAKGADKLAKEIRRIARREGVITLENKPLARALFKAVKVGGEVPPDLYQAVASVLAFVYRVRGRR